MTRISQLRMRTMYAWQLSFSPESVETVGKMVFAIVVGTIGGLLGFSPQYCPQCWYKKMDMN